jgi:hypothetical protein
MSSIALPLNPARTDRTEFIREAAMMRCLQAGVPAQKLLLWDRFNYWLEWHTLSNPSAVKVR